MDLYQDSLVSRRFYVGVDLGKISDYTAIAVLEKSEYLVGPPNGYDWVRQSETRFLVRHLERIPLDTSYVDVARHIASVLKSHELERNSSLIIDATGVGLAVVDFIRRQDLGFARLFPVVLTSGIKTTHDGRCYHVPKTDLIMNLVLLFEHRRIKIAKKIPQAQLLAKELLEMSTTISTSGHQSFGPWRDNEHDDLVLALALAIWRAQSTG